MIKDFFYKKPKTPQSSRGNFLIKFLFGLVFLLIVIGIGALAWWFQMSSPVEAQDKQTVVFEIPSGFGVNAIGNLLFEKKLIRNQLAFKIQVNLSGLSKSLQAGKFSLSPSMDLKTLTQALVKAEDSFISVTIPEGKRREEIAFILAKAFADGSVKFSVADFLELTQDKEGFLFPDTYKVTHNMETKDVVKLLVDNFNTKVGQVSKNQLNDSDIQKIINIASLVEREAKFDVDRPLVAGVIFNRLEKPMRLQLDATIQYALGENFCASDDIGKCNWWPVVTDTTYNSPYNTYQVDGLPPTPICNPGLKSIEAVLNPDTHGYYYYLSEPSGKTYYSKTLQEHEEKIEKYLN